MTEHFYNAISGYIFAEQSYTFNDYSLAEVGTYGRLPINRDKICKVPFAIDCEALEENEKITLTWTAVDDADGYVVQLCQNTQFVGPTMKGINVGLVLTYPLGLQCDIWYGVTYFWRIFAYNDTGGASPKSEVYEFEVVCPDMETNPSGPGSNVAGCSDHGVTIALTNPGAQIVCTKQFTSYVTASWTSDNISVEGFTWTVEGPATSSNEGLTYIDIDVGQCQNGNVVITYELDLQYDGGTTFTCRESFSFIANGGCGQYNVVVGSYISNFSLTSTALILCETDKTTFLDPCGNQYTEFGNETCMSLGVSPCAP